MREEGRGNVDSVGARGEKRFRLLIEWDGMMEAGKVGRGSYVGDVAKCNRCAT